MIKKIPFIGIVLFISACSKNNFNVNSRIHNFPTYVPTETVPISLQQKKIYSPSEEVFFSNNFEGGRLNSVYYQNQGYYKVNIEAENYPINNSPWYAFKIWSNSRKAITFCLNYKNATHRYKPKWTVDGIKWTITDSTKVSDTTQNSCFKINVSPDTVTVAAQELFTTKNLDHWLQKLATKNSDITIDSYGVTSGGHNLKMMSLYGFRKNKRLVILFSRQHPPEVTGQFALMHFVERLIENDPLMIQFRENFDVWVFPMLNPDGVNQGHWRHGLGGVDLNRDWDKYNQLETRLTANFITSKAKRIDNEVVLGIDFHSTWHDIYYTNVSDTATLFPHFTKNWIQNIRTNIKGYEPKVSQSKIGKPISKSWFFTQFEAVGVTYEIGDNTPRDFIKQKSRISAEEMVKILLK